VWKKVSIDFNTLLLIEGLDFSKIPTPRKNH
jgi:hypothetical protein